MVMLRLIRTVQFIAFRFNCLIMKCNEGTNAYCDGCDIIGADIEGPIEGATEVRGPGPLGA